MNEENPKRLSIDVAAQISGLDADEVVSPHYMALKPIFRRRASGPFSTQIDQFAFILRVDGCIRAWDLPALSHVDYKKRWRGISVDVHVPEKIWKSGHICLAEHISTAFHDGMLLMIERLKSKKIDVYETELITALEASMADYLEWASKMNPPANQ